MSVEDNLKAMTPKEGAANAPPGVDIDTGRTATWQATRPSAPNAPGRDNMPPGSRWRPSGRHSNPGAAYMPGGSLIGGSEVPVGVTGLRPGEFMGSDGKIYGPYVGNEPPSKFPGGPSQADILNGGGYTINNKVFQAAQLQQSLEEARLKESKNFHLPEITDLFPEFSL